LCAYVGGTSNQNPPCDFSSEAVDFTVDDVDCKNFHVVGELAGTDLSDNAECEFLDPHSTVSGRDLQFIECNDWTARSVDYTDTLMWK
jgi:hypothetical protein